MEYEKIIKRLRYKIKVYINRLFFSKIYGITYLYDSEYRKKIHKDYHRKKYNRNIGQLRCSKRKRQVKNNLFRRKGNKCFWCKKKMKYRHATIDHIVPVSKGGSNHQKNLRLIHEWCRVQRDRKINKQSNK